MGIFDRLLLVFYSLFLTLAMLLFAAFLAGWKQPMQYLYGLYAVGEAEGIAVLAVLILIGLRLFWAAIKGTGTGAATESVGRYVMLSDGAKGEVRVSVQAVETLVEKTALQISGIREVKPQVVSTAQGISLKIKAGVTPDLVIPKVSELLQNQVAEKVLSVTGITVLGVEVSVESIGNTKHKVV